MFLKMITKEKCLISDDRGRSQTLFVCADEAFLAKFLFAYAETLDYAA